MLFISSGGEKKEENVAAARPRVNLEGPAPRDNLPAGARRRRPGEAGLLLSKTICTRHHRLPGAGSNPVIEAGTKVLPISGSRRKALLGPPRPLDLNQL